MYTLIFRALPQIHCRVIPGGMNYINTGKQLILKQRQILPLSAPLIEHREPYRLFLPGC